MDDDKDNKSATINFRAAQPTDGGKMWEVIDAIGTLERNTTYAYVLLANHFGQTCLIAEDGDTMAGFIAGYRPPTDYEAVFVWQIGVHPDYRGQGLGTRMLNALVELPGCEGVRFLSATVAPSNEASVRLFTGFARKRDVPCEVTSGFQPEYFLPVEHEAEELYRIGPLHE